METNDVMMRRVLRFLKEVRNIEFDSEPNYSLLREILTKEAPGEKAPGEKT